ncbi:MAG TPA: 3-hydroxyacyl-CoA dehydrogenase family protein [Candidatus Angelobacter sp.]|nr:3-hydroxyacyl-CoA dehydrogenase family protein [Candidatus Angelobacter sp.]
MEFTHVGVVGAGVMGIGLAQSLAETGHQVVLMDNDEKQLEKAREAIRSNLRMSAFFSKKKPGAEKADVVIERILFTTDPNRLEVSQFLIENVVEKPQVKEEVYRRIDPLCRKDCIFAANTSAISITRIASWTQRPAQILGMHFMNPVPLKPVVEVIRGFHTSEATLDKAKTLLAEMGKEGIVVNDMPGFVSNRVLMLTINEAIYLVQDQVASAEDVDRLFKTCFGHKMGPLETGDLIGLDTILYSLDVLYESYNDDKFRPCPLLKKMVYAGLHGRKSGRGFYNYEGEFAAAAN